MEYNFNAKKVNNEIDLTISEAKIFEILIKYDGVPVSTKKIVDEIHKEPNFTYIPHKRNIAVHVFRINQKLNWIIKNKHCYGYYIEEEIKIY